MIAWARQHWQTVAFLLVLTSTVLVRLMAQPSQDIAWCDKEDRSVAVCTRNWFNAAGNAVTGAVAVIAVYLAYQQVKAAKHQLGLARIPGIRDRIVLLDDINYLAAELILNIRPARSYARGAQIEARQREQVTERFERHWSGLLEQIKNTKESCSSIRDLERRASHDPLITSLVEQVDAAARSFLKVAEPALSYPVGYFDWVQIDQDFLPGIVAEVEETEKRLRTSREQVDELRQRLVAELQVIDRS